LQNLAAAAARNLPILPLCDSADSLPRFCPQRFLSVVSLRALILQAYCFLATLAHGKEYVVHREECSAFFAPRSAETITARAESAHSDNDTRRCFMQPITPSFFGFIKQQTRT
jgi:hypothetical protein